jgi:hypothetical protein
MAVNITAEIEALLNQIFNPFSNQINTLLNAALQESAVTLQISSMDLMIRFMWVLLITSLFITIPLCMTYAALRAKNQAMLGRCICAILSFPLSLVVLVYVRRGSRVVFGYKLYDTTAVTEDTFPLEGTSDRVKITKSTI